MTDFTAEAPPQIGEIVQANERVPHWYRCFIIVEEIKSWGIQGFTTIPNKGDAYIRLQWDEIEKTGGHTRFITGEMRDAIEAARGANPDLVQTESSDDPADGGAVSNPAAEPS